MANSNQDFIKHSLLCGLPAWIPCLEKNLEAHRRGAFEMFSRTKQYLRDRYAIADSIIGHLPREISSATRFLLLRGEMIHLKVTDENYRRSLVIQGVLETPFEVICEIDDTPR